MTLSQDFAATHKKASADFSIRAKGEIRALVLAAIGADKAHVFDAFAGTGEMHRVVWHEAQSYVGCDVEFFRDDRLAFVADNQRVLRSLDLAAFNIFDLDAYGSPWEQAYIIAHRRRAARGERLGFVLTDGSAMNFKMGGMSRVLTKLSGVRPKPGLARQGVHDEVMLRAMSRVAEMMNAKIVRRWQATGKYGSHMVYLGVVLDAI